MANQALLYRFVAGAGAGELLRAELASPAAAPGKKSKADENLPEGLTRYSDGTYGVDYRDANGRRIRKKVSRLKQEAKDYYAEMVRLRRLGEVLPKKPVAVARPKLAGFLETYREHATNPTDRLYAGKWIEMIGQLEPEQLTADKVRSWMKKVLDGGMKPATMQRWLSPLRAVYTQLEKKDVITSRQNPLKDTKALGFRPLNNERTFHLEPQAELRMLEVFGERWWPYVAFSILSGIRFANQAELEWEWVDWRNKRLRIPKTKNQRAHVVHLNGQAVQILAEMEGRRAKGCIYIFPSPRGKKLTRHNWRSRVWLPAARAAGVKGFTWHGLRHTLASRLAMAGKSLTEIAAALGLRTPRMVQRYAHLAERHMDTVMESVSVTSSWTDETDRTFSGHPEPADRDFGPVGKAFPVQ